MGEPTENEIREWEDSQIAKGRTIHREGELRNPVSKCDPVADISDWDHFK